MSAAIFYLFFSCYGRIGVVKNFIVHKRLNIVFFSKTIDKAFFVLPNSFNQIGSNTRV